MAFSHDLRGAWRSLVKRPIFSLSVIAILGLGLGAATTVIDLTNLLAWRLLPVERSEQLVRVYTGNLRGFAGPWGFTSWSDYVDYRDNNSSFSTLAAHRDVELRFDSGDQTRSHVAAAVSGNYFETLGLKPSEGRGLTIEDDQAGSEPVVVLSHHLWQTLDPSRDWIGASVKIEGSPFTVVGIGPEGFKTDLAGHHLDFFLAAHQLPKLGQEADLLTDRGLQRFALMGRLAEGMTRTDAELEIGLIAQRLDAAHPLDGSDAERRISTTPARIAHPVDFDRLAPSLRLFMIAVALLLAITCANVAHLLLARAAGRRREMAVRQSLGAGRTRLIRQLLTENVLLAFAGGVLGLVIAKWGRAYLTAFAGDAFAEHLSYDWRVLALVFAICLGTAVLFGLAPALATTRFELRSALHAGTGPNGKRSGGWLAGAQIALSVILLCTGALLALSLQGRLSADLGFDDERLLISAVSLSSVEYSAEEGARFFEELRERAEALPGVEKAGRALIVPPILFDISITYRLPGDIEDRRSRLNYVDEHYFDTMGIRVEQGRGIAQTDTPESQPVVVINRVMAEQLWPGEDPIGRVIEQKGARPGDSGPNLTVVGVVNSVDQFRASSGGEPILYFSTAQRHRPRQRMVLRTSADAEATFAALRGVLREMDPGLALVDTSTGRANREFAFTFERMQVTALTIFAGSGLLLSILGLFAVLSYGVSRRIRAIGIRMAVGARGGDILRQVIGRGLRLAVAGTAAGLVVLLAASSYLSGLLFGVEATDPRVLAAVVVTVLVSAIVAAYLPARRASRLDPLQALRHE